MHVNLYSFSHSLTFLSLCCFFSLLDTACYSSNYYYYRCVCELAETQKMANFWKILLFFGQKSLLCVIKYEYKYIYQAIDRNLSINSHALYNEAYTLVVPDGGYSGHLDKKWCKDIQCKFTNASHCLLPSVSFFAKRFLRWHQNFDHFSFFMDFWRGKTTSWKNFT